MSQVAPTPLMGPLEAYIPISQLLLPLNLPPKLDEFLIDSQQPPTITEQWLLQEGCYPLEVTRHIFDTDRLTEAGM